MAATDLPPLEPVVLPRVNLSFKIKFSVNFGILKHFQTNLKWDLARKVVLTNSNP